MSLMSVVAEGIKRRFGDREVIRGISFEVGWGRIASFLGPNGAGKTTLIRILTTELMPHGGRAEVAGFDVVHEPGEVRRRIAVVPQESRPMTFITPWEFVYSYLLLRGISRIEAKLLARRSLEELGLWDVKDKACYSLSGGTKRKVLVAAALASNADVVFLDEPTVGLDLAARSMVWEILSRYRDSGASIILTTHYIGEAEYISDEVFLIDGGVIISRGNPRELVERIPGKYAVEVSPDSGIQCTMVGNRCIAFVDSVDGLDGAIIRITPKSLEHYVLITVRSWRGEVSDEQ